MAHQEGCQLPLGQEAVIEFGSKGLGNSCTEVGITGVPGTGPIQRNYLTLANCTRDGLMYCILFGLFDAQI